MTSTYQQDIKNFYPDLHELGISYLIEPLVAYPYHPHSNGFAFGELVD